MPRVFQECLPRSRRRRSLSCPCGATLHTTGNGEKGGDGDDHGAKKTTGNKHQQDVNVPLANSVLSTSKAISDIEALECTKYHIWTGRGCVAVVQNAGKGYDEESNNLKKLAWSGQPVDHKTRGTPYLAIFVAVFGKVAMRTVTELM
ncbi:unnamed protein product [Prorocentrum cordatum]|uniref:Subtilisin n=1 Tax=Prorocentrum cordatum TaxID=2364126 RepID=A0ABN9VHY4_9DINO|nr:unnamed protein product [Polarella glacialis]